MASTEQDKGGTACSQAVSWVTVHARGGGQSPGTVRIFWRVERYETGSFMNNFPGWEVLWETNRRRSAPPSVGRGEGPRERLRLIGVGIGIAIAMGIRILSGVEFDPDFDTDPDADRVAGEASLGTSNRKRGDRITGSAG